MKRRTLNELRQTREYGYTPPSPTRYPSITPQPAPLKNEVLDRLEGLKDKVFKYGDYHHYTKYDFNVQKTLKKLDEVIKAVKSGNTNYGVKHLINNIIDEDDRD
tara:strand:- start:35 stop:346 length:312 start_codon:yes stop_codon:yes gene_type:complete